MDPVKDEGDLGPAPFLGRHPLLPQAAHRLLGEGEPGPHHLGLPGEVVGAALLVEEEALYVQEALLEVVLGVVEGKLAVAGEAQGEEGPLGQGLPEAHLHPVAGVAQDRLQGVASLRPGREAVPLAVTRKARRSPSEAKPRPPRKRGLQHHLPLGLRPAV